jgi:hypothetical protein
MECQIDNTNQMKKNTPKKLLNDDGHVMRVGSGDFMRAN